MWIVVCDVVLNNNNNKFKYLIVYNSCQAQAKENLRSDIHIYKYYCNVIVANEANIIVYAYLFVYTNSVYRIN